MEKEIRTDRIFPLKDATFILEKIFVILFIFVRQLIRKSGYGC